MADGQQGPLVVVAGDPICGGGIVHPEGSEPRAAVVLLLPMPGLRPETLRIRQNAGSLVISAVGRSALVGIEPAVADRLSTIYEHDIELDHRIDSGAIRAELHGGDGIRVVLPLRRRAPEPLTNPSVNQPVG